MALSGVKHRFRKSSEERPGNLCVSYSKCIAKSDLNNNQGISVVEHCNNAANVAKILAYLFPDKNFYEKFGVILAAVHDVGKISPGFQKKICSKLSDGLETDHALIGESAVREYLDEFYDSSAAGEIVGIHHGERKSKKPNRYGVFGGDKWADERLKFIGDFEKQFGKLPKDSELDLLNRAILAGFICISDWISSDEKYFPASGLPDDSNLEKISRNAVLSCGFSRPKLKTGLSFKDIFKVSPYSSQEKFIEAINGSGLYILEAATGSGKTEAALFAAYKLISEGYNNGLYFGLPTKLTSDRIHSRVQNFADKICETRIPVMLSHGSAWLNDEVMKIIESGGDEMGPGGSWFCPRKRTLLAPFGVGTIDQALFAVMNVKHYFVRAFGLAGKVIILDEVHSYDIYTGTILDKLAEFARKAGSSVIILSATLTKERKKPFFHSSSFPETDHYPLITVENASGVKTKTAEDAQTKHVGISFMSRDEIGKVAEEAVRRAESGQSVLWICNTVAGAQSNYKLLNSMKKDKSFDAGLLHSRFLVGRRRELEDKWMERLGKTAKRSVGSVLVATQVVEQSVDIDADYLISELAPSDMLIQRIGRLWRHPREDRPAKKTECLIISENLKSAGNEEELINLLGKNNSKVYAPYVLWKTWHVWENIESICMPADIRKILEATYSGNESEEPDFIRSLHRELTAEYEKLKQRANAMLAGVSMPAGGDDEDRATTRYSEIPTIDCLLVEDLDSKRDDEAEITLLSGKKVKVSKYVKDISVSRLLHKYIVPVAIYNFKDSKDSLKVPPFLTKHSYGNLVVLKKDNAGNLFLNDTPTILRYTDELGIHKKDSVSIESERIVNYNKRESGEFDYELDNW